MTIFDMLGQSGSLTILGMGVVFGFLVIMVICVTIMGKIIGSIGRNKDVDGSVSDVEASGTTKSTAVAAAIIASVNEYQKDNG